MATADTCVLYNKELVFSLSEDSPEFTHEIIITNVGDGVGSDGQIV